MAIILISFSIKWFISWHPGSDIKGEPESDIKDTALPDKINFLICSFFLSKSWSVYLSNLTLILYLESNFLLLFVFSQRIRLEFFKIFIARIVISSKLPMGVATKYNPVSIILFSKNIFLLITLISFFSCAPTTIETIKKAEPESEPKTQIDELKSENDKVLEKEVQKLEIAQKPENKIINFSEIENTLVFLSEDSLLTTLFYDVFLRNIDNYQYLQDIKFVYSIDEIGTPLNNTIIIGPTSSEELNLLPPKLGNNTFILALSNDYSLIEKFADNEIVFIPNSPYLHIEKLKAYIQKAETIGVLYKQNDYGLKVFNHFKKNYPLIYTKSSSFGTSAIDLELSVNLLGSLDELDFIIIIDDTYSYKDLVGYLATDKKTYPLEKVYLIDNFLEQRNNLENYYKPINRSNFDNIDITEMIEPHREYLFKQSIEVALSIADKTLQKQNFLNKIYHENLGNLDIRNQMIDYPIIFD